MGQGPNAAEHQGLGAEAAPMAGGGGAAAPPAPSIPTHNKRFSSSLVDKAAVTAHKKNTHKERLKQTRKLFLELLKQACALTAL